MSRSLAHAIEAAATELDRSPHSLLKDLGVPAPSFYNWKAGKFDARPEKAAQILLMLDGMRYRHEGLGFTGWLRSLVA